MRQTKSLNEVLARGSPKLKELRKRLAERERVLDYVKAAVPADLAAHVVSAGLQDGRLIIGTPSSAWASRLRYVTPDLKAVIGQQLGLDIVSVRVKIVTRGT